MWIAVFVGNKGNDPFGSIPVPKDCPADRRPDKSLHRQPVRALYFWNQVGMIAAMKNRRASADKLIVVIEDNELVLDATSGLLRSWGFQVVAAKDFAEALRQLADLRRRPDLIVCDYCLSKGTTGVEVIAGLRGAFEIPALLISGDSSCPGGDLARNSYQLLHKPLSVDTFRAALIDACVLAH
jgi:CheY-like chemotaxis protein